MVLILTPVKQPPLPYPRPCLPLHTSYSILFPGVLRLMLLQVWHDARLAVSFNVYVDGIRREADTRG